LFTEKMVGRGFAVDLQGGTAYTNVVQFPLLHQVPRNRKTLQDAYLSGRKAVV
jgi:hypothetical protein